MSQDIGDSIDHNPQDTTASRLFDLGRNIGDHVRLYGVIPLHRRAAGQRRGDAKAAGSASTSGWAWRRRRSAGCSRCGCGCGR